MAKKMAAKSKPRTGAKAAMAEHSKDGTSAPKKKAGFGKRAKASGVAHASKSAAAKTAPAKTSAKRASKSTIGKAIHTAVGAVSSTVSGVAGQASSLFKRRRTEKS